MPVSQAQILVWKARAQLDRKLAKLTPSQQSAYLDGVFERVRRKTGVDLDLPFADAPSRRPARRRASLRRFRGSSRLLKSS
jgi:hypothetical protein